MQKLPLQYTVFNLYHLYRILIPPQPAQINALQRAFAKVNGKKKNSKTCKFLENRYL